MNQMPKLSPSNALVGREFNMPFFKAVKQMYRCIEVKETTNNAFDHKKYIISFDWVVSSYSVPEKIEIELFIPHRREKAILTIFEITPNDSKSVITKTHWEKNKLITLSSLKEVFKTTAIEKFK